MQHSLQSSRPHAPTVDQCPVTAALVQRCAGGRPPSRMITRMPSPRHTLPMMAGGGPFGSMEMGSMFTLLKVRDDIAPSDYREPGPYQA